MKSYVRDKDLVADGVLPIPLQLWNWGIQNRTGKLRVFPKELVQLQLLPRDIATVNYKGIQFKGISYSCEKAIQEMWFENARMKKSWTVDVVYDPRNMTNIYVISEDTGLFEMCFMLESSKRYSGLSLDEISYWRNEEKMNEKGQNHGQLQKDIEFIEDVENVIKKAKEAKRAEKDHSLSKKEKTESIKKHRKLEKQYKREQESKPIVDLPTKEGTLVELENVSEKVLERSGVREFLKRRKEDSDG